MKQTTINTGRRSVKRTMNLLGAAFFILHSSLFISCSDQLDLAPQGEFTAEQLTDESIEGLMSSAYQGLEAHFFDDNNAAFAGPITNWVFDVRSDDAYKGGEGVSMEANIHQLEIQNITSDNATCLNKWENNYLGIARVHKAMLAIQDATVGDKASLLGELKTLRAWYYFDLNRIFKSIPYFTENDDPKTVTNGNMSRDEIYSAIKADLEEAYSAMPETQDQPGRFTKYVAAALLAKVNAQTSSWAEVAKWADVVIQSGKYQLYDNFADMSKLAFNNKKESIMAIQFSTANDNIHINFCNLLNTTRSEGNVFGSGDDFFLGSQNLVNAFRTDPATGLPYLDGTFNKVNVTENYTGTLDPRLDLTVGRIGLPFRGHLYTQGWCRDYNTYGEYSGKKGLIDPSSPDMVQGFPWGASGLNFNLIRYADIVLLKAEALIEQATGSNAAEDDKLVEARTLVNQIRQKAARSVDGSYSPVDLDPSKADYFVGLYPTDWDGNLYWTKERARMALRFERRLELAMEGQRWFDLVRWGTAVETVNKYMQEEAALRPYYTGASLTEDEIYLPIPISQIENSNGLYK